MNNNNSFSEQPSHRRTCLQEHPQVRKKIFLFAKLSLVHGYRRTSLQIGTRNANGCGYLEKQGLGHAAIRQWIVWTMTIKLSLQFQAIDKKIGAQDVNVKAVQELLRTVHKSGNWQTETSTKGSYGPSLFKSAEPNSAVVFRPTIKKKGRYDLYMYLPKIDGLSDVITVTVVLENTRKAVPINAKDLRVEGQTSGEWVSLGNFLLQEGTSICGDLDIC